MKKPFVSINSYSDEGSNHVIIRTNTNEQINTKNPNITHFIKFIFVIK